VSRSPNRVNKLVADRVTERVVDLFEAVESTNRNASPRGSLRDGVLRRERLQHLEQLATVAERRSLIVTAWGVALLGQRRKSAGEAEPDAGRRQGCGASPSAPGRRGARADSRIASADAAAGPGE